MKQSSYLFLREVGNVAGHGGGDDEASSLSLSEVQTSSSGAVVDTGQIGLDDLLPLLDGSIEDTGIGGTAGVGDEDIDLAKILDDIGNQLLDILVVADVALVCLGLDTVFVLQLLCVLLSTLGSGSVGDGDVGAELGTATCSFSADASGA